MSVGSPRRSRGTEHGWVLLLASVAVAAVLAPGSARAEEEPTRQDDGLVIIRESKGVIYSAQNTRTGRVEPRKVELQITLQNRLDRPINDFEFDLAYSNRKDGPLHHVPVSTSKLVGARQPGFLQIFVPLDDSVQMSNYEVSLTRYRVVEPSGEVLLQLVSSAGGLVDRAAAVLAIESLGGASPTYRARVAGVLADAVRKGPRRGGEPDDERAGGLAPLFALRALGPLGSAEHVPLILATESKGDVWGEQLAQLVALQDEFPTHPMSLMFPSEPDLSKIVAQTLQAMPDGAAVAPLVTAAYGKEAGLRRLASTQLAAGWPKLLERVAALKKPSAAAARAALCGADDADGVRLLLALAALGADEGKASACIAAMPDRVAIPGLARSLSDPLGPAGAIAVDLLLARGEAGSAALTEAAQALGLPLEGSARSLADAVAQALREKQQARFAAALAQAEGRLAAVAASKSLTERDAAFDAAAARLTEAEELAADAKQRAELAAAYVRYADRALERGVGQRVSDAFARMPVLLGDKPEDGAADAALVAFARRAGESMEGMRAAALLRRLESLLYDPANRPGLADGWVALAGHTRGSLAEKEQYAKKALELDPGSAPAKRILASIAAERRAPYFVLGAVVLGLCGLAFGVMWRGRRGFGRGFCAVCGRYSALNRVTFRYAVGMFAKWREVRKGGPLCKRCIHKTFWTFSGLDAALGWWSPVSFAVTPAFLLTNAYHYLSSLLLPANLEADAVPTQPVPRLGYDALREKIAALRSNGLSNAEVAERLEREHGVPRAETLALLGQLDQGVRNQGAA